MARSRRRRMESSSEYKYMEKQIKDLQLENEKLESVIGVMLKAIKLFNKNLYDEIIITLGIKILKGD